MHRDLVHDLSFSLTSSLMNGGDILFNILNISMTTSCIFLWWIDIELSFRRSSLRRLVTKWGILKMLSLFTSNCSVHLSLAQNKRKIANNKAKFHLKGNIPFYTFKLFPTSEVWDMIRWLYRPSKKDSPAKIPRKNYQVLKIL